MSFKLWLALGIGLGGMSSAFAACPDPLPERPTGPEMVSCLQDLQRQVKTLSGQLSGVSSVIPSGAVVAFDLNSKCPKGWDWIDETKGRIIVGSGQGAQLSDRPYRQQDGNESILLNVDQIPPHVHPIVALTMSEAFGATFGVKEGGWFANRVLVIPRASNAGSEQPLQDKSGPTQQTGQQSSEQNSVETMPPFLSLYYCRKK